MTIIGTLLDSREVPRAVSRRYRTNIKLLSFTIITGGNSSEPVTDNLDKFYCKSNGVLYEDSVVQIGVKTECKSNLARLALFYGNKTSYPFLVSTI